MFRFPVVAAGLAASLWLCLATVPARGQEREDFAFGVIVDSTDPRSMNAARGAGFTHAKMITFWDRLEPGPGHFFWHQTEHNDFDNILRAARAEEMKLVVRVDGVPGWAGGSPANADLDAVEGFYYALALHGRGTAVAYEILNEPNLPFEWGGPPSPEGYAEFMKAAYRGVKAADPDALILGGGPSPGTGGRGGTVEDVEFLRRMYQAGAKGHMDALAVHNYGGNTEPERDPNTCLICFRRAELYRQIMVEFGDGATPVWATEYGWLMDSGTYLGQYDWMKVSPEQQADFVVRSYKFALEKWPWMQGMLLSNLDASTTPYHTGAEDGLPWFAILNGDYSPRPAWDAFKGMRDAQLALLARARAEQAAIRQRALEARQRAQQSAAAAELSDPGADAPAPSGAAAARLRVTGTGGEGLSLRSAPTTNAARLKTLPDGSTLEGLGQEQAAEGRSWRQVRDQAGATGWVAAEFVRPG